MARNGDVMRSDRLKQVMQQIDPNFDERNAGFNRFSKFVVEAGQKGVVQVTKLDNGQYEVAPGTAARRRRRAPARPRPSPAAAGRRRRPRGRDDGGEPPGPARAEVAASARVGNGRRASTPGGPRRDARRAGARAPTVR